MQKEKSGHPGTKWLPGSALDGLVKEETEQGDRETGE